MEFTPNKEYSRLLIENANYHHKVRAGKGSYTSPEYRELQRRLTEIEVKISSDEIIQHAEHCFPKVGP